MLWWINLCIDEARTFKRRKYIKSSQFQGYIRKYHSYKMSKQPSLLPQLEFLGCVYRQQYPHCNSLRVRCINHTEEAFASDYSKVLFEYEVGRNHNLIKIDTDYLHSFSCLINENCNTGRCLDCRLRLQNGRITWHTQFVRIIYTGSWITEVISNILQNIWQQQRGDALWLAPML